MLHTWSWTEWKWRQFFLCFSKLFWRSNQPDVFCLETNVLPKFPPLPQSIGQEIWRETQCFFCWRSEFHPEVDQFPSSDDDRPWWHLLLPTACEKRLAKNAHVKKNSSHTKNICGRTKVKALQDNLLPECCAILNIYNSWLDLANAEQKSGSGNSLR